MSKTRVFITGGATGIGRAVGELYLRNGATVGVCGFQAPDEIGPLPMGFHYYQADVTNEQQLKEAIDGFAYTFKGLDVVIANAGLNMPKTLVPDTAKGKQLTLVNVMGVVYTFGAALEHFLKQRHGQFVAISSLSGLNGLPGMSYYGASKAFVSTFCESLSSDLNQKNIHITCVHPGFIATDFTKANTHPMPFLLSQEQAARIIYKAILKKKPQVFFPRIPAYFMGLLRRLPRCLYQQIMKKDLLKLRQT